jgi:dienelactone hydrolase
MATNTDVQITAGDAALAATVVLPRTPRGVVVFAHGSGSSRHSPRNRQVARHLNDGGYGTVLLDLLTAHEEADDRLTRRHRFDVALLGGRLVAAVDWVAAGPGPVDLTVGLFGASTGAAAALLAAAARPGRVAAVVSRGGRPDLAGAALGAVRAPTLLIVGGEDHEVAALNRRAAAALGPTARLAVVPGATHLFGEPGALEQVTDQARAWFDRHLRRGAPVAGDVAEPPA